MIQSFRTKSRAGRKDRRGSALIASMMFVMVVAGMGVVMVQIHTSQTKRQDQSIDNKRAIYIAEAGLAEGFLGVAQGMTGDVGRPDAPARFGDGYFWVEANELPNGQISLLSTGMVGRGRFTISAVLEQGGDPIASLGFLSGGDLIVGEGSLVDGFDSKDGSFLSQVDGLLPGGTTGDGAKLAAMGDVVLHGTTPPGGLPIPTGTVVYGDAQPGPSGSVTSAGDVTVTGTTTPMASDVTLPPVELPNVEMRRDVTIGIGNNLVLEDGEYGVSKIRIADGAGIKLVGPATLVIGQLVMGDSSSITVDSTEGQVRIFVSERLYVPSTASLVSTQQDPDGFLLMLTTDQWLDFDEDGRVDDPLVFEPDGEFYGYIYGPTVDIEIGAGTHLIGGVAANTITIAPGSHISFDSALEGTEMAVSGLPVLVAWRIADVPDQPITRRNTTPDAYIEENALVTTRSPDAHLEAFVWIKYYDLTGTPQSYMGPAAGLDWSQVGEVLGIMWDDDAVVGDEGQDWELVATMSKRMANFRETSGKVVR